MESIVAKFRHQLETRGEYVALANISSGWFAVFPEKWHDRFPYYDEIWVGSSFIANALATVSPIPVVRIPPVLALDASGSRAAGRRRLGVRADQFVFLFIFDFHSFAERKNPMADTSSNSKVISPMSLSPSL